MSLRAVLDVLLVEVQGYLQESPLLAVCRLAHRKAAFEVHLRWLVGYWRLSTERVRAQHDFLAREVRASRRLLNNVQGWDWNRYDLQSWDWDHWPRNRHIEDFLTEYAMAIDRVHEILGDALMTRVRLSSDP